MTDAAGGGPEEGYRESLLRPAPDWVRFLQRAPEARAGVRIHLVGIGGSGLSAIAGYLLDQGYTVSGSDQHPNEASDALAARGATVFRGHKPEHIGNADLVLISSAVSDTNPEVVAAHAAGIPVLKRSELLGPLTEGQHAIGVAGTHGKTTTTAMIAVVFSRAGMDPSFIVGGRLNVGPAEGMPSTSVAARAGRGPFIIEADEYDQMFLGLRLETAVITNVEWDHVDCYPTPQAFADAFRQLVSQLPAGGLLLLCADDPGALALAAAAPAGVEIRTYGLSEGSAWQARNLTPNEAGGLDAEVWHAGELVTELKLPVPGHHNVRNALGALAVAHWHGIRPAWSAVMLRDFAGAGRRFEFIGEAAGVVVIDDYAHHPTEVAATLAAARLRYPSRRIWAVFQPHTFSRTKALKDDYARSFDDADRVLVLDIFAAREKMDLGMHSRLLLKSIAHASAAYVGTIEAAAMHLLSSVEPEDVVITMSAGDGNRVGQLLLAGLRQRRGGK